MDTPVSLGSPAGTRGVRSVLAGTALILLWAFAGAAGVGAQPNANGNNGTLKVHEPPHEDPGEIRNEPHVCPFHLHGYHFDDNSSGTFRIERWSPTGSGVVASGTWSADGVGTWMSRAFNASGTPTDIPAGHYKAFAKQTNPSTPGGFKQKVFWVECGNSGGGGAVEESPSPSNGGNGGGGDNNGNNGAVKPATPPRSGGELPAAGAAGAGGELTLPPTTTASGSNQSEGTSSIWLVLVGLALMTAGLFVLRPGMVKAGR